MALILNNTFLLESSREVPVCYDVQEEGHTVIHPEFLEDAKVYCNGALVMTTGRTQKEYTVYVWSSNHPFYVPQQPLRALYDQVEKFRKNYGELSQVMAPCSKVRFCSLLSANPFRLKEASRKKK